MTEPRMPLHGLPAEQVLTALEASKRNDVQWQQGRTFGLVFDGGPEVREVADQAAQLFLHDNALNPAAFPSLAGLQADLCQWTASMLNGPEAAGFVTSGGTESILMAVKAARERARIERGITEPEIVLAESAHAAFHKAAHLFGLTVRSTPVAADWTADPVAMAAHVGSNTALVVASAPQYPQGVVDPVAEIAALAATVDANCHVDACMGGFVLPFAEKEGWPSPLWDFRVPGVTSISADIHKLGYAPKGVSILLHANKELRRYQVFMFDDWLGGRYGTPNLQGTRSGLPMAAAWAVMSFLGEEGYRRLVRSTLETADQIREAVHAIEGIALLGNSTHHLLAITGDGLNVLSVGALLGDRGWHIDSQGPPDSLHLTVSAGNQAVVEEFLEDLRWATNQAPDSPEATPTDYAAP